MKDSIFKKKEKKSFAFVEDDIEENKEENLNAFLTSGRGQSKQVLNTRGRPKKAKQDLKTEPVIVYMTKEQKESLQEKAEKSSLSVSKYILLKVFGLE